jgi:predicted nuclease of restriction endonuclease-like (RecB) superfamily
VNRELVLLYWQIGRELGEKIDAGIWGAKVIDTLARDLQSEFPGTGGFSRTNLYRMRAFYTAYPAIREIVPQAVGQISSQLPDPLLNIPWGHNVILLEKVKDPSQREWYARQTIEYGWSRAVLHHQIQSDLYSRQGKAITNFPGTLPAPQSDLALELVRDPYIFDFLGRSAEVSERELQVSLLEKLRDFLVELGIGFAFLGSEYQLEIGDQDFYLDLLFYHTRLHCYIIIELKVGTFVPEYAGKLNFYLSAADDLLRDPPVDQPTIGILLCREKNRVIAEYALRDMAKPMAVSSYHLGQTLPPQFQEQLPDTDRLKDLILQSDTKPRG